MSRVLRPKSLCVISWNANGVKNKKIELQDFLDKYSVDVCLIQENMLKYQTHRADWPTRVGGTLVAVKRCIQHHEIVKPSANLEESIVAVQMEKSEIRVGSVYFLAFLFATCPLKSIFVSDGLEQKSRVKRPRAPPPPDPENDVDGDFDERNNDLSTNFVPAGFLSPSVLEYLELGKSIPGRPGTDYPVLGMVPYTNFYCDEQQYPGFYADPETRCQSWHYCDIDGRQTSFLCPNGTQFSQLVFVCDWWFNVRCELSEKLYVINSRLYGRPKLDPAKPHRSITKQLLEDIFNDEERR
ncbi:uncharacterized protein LOC125505135 [Dendroctonus ponderosae]|uniref:uncharacterized protein LOC125505135 n=1 Tax=Dendroctonus ponderosae TaxID=77166 RepID=UPI00203559FF|nr:uncharacterized protein LOC125505135 [Dendroctonus ponderosae]